MLVMFTSWVGLQSVYTPFLQELSPHIKHAQVCFPLHNPEMKESTEGSGKAKPQGNLAFWKKLSKLQLQWEYNEIRLDNYDTGETVLKTFPTKYLKWHVFYLLFFS